MEKVLFVLMLSLRIKRRYRDVTVKESGVVSKLEKGLRIAVVGRHHGMNKLTERRQGHGMYYDHSFECRNFVCESF
jgi:hypothetical protein